MILHKYITRHELDAVRQFLKMGQREDVQDDQLYSYLKRREYGILNRSVVGFVYVDEFLAEAKMEFVGKDVLISWEPENKLENSATFPSIADI